MANGTPLGGGKPHGQGPGEAGAKPWRTPAGLASRVAAVLLAAAAGTAWAQDLPRGQVVPRVACRSAPGFTYALYLPAGYTPDKAWPVIFCFDPAGAGERPVHLLERSAETYGYILMGSWDARNGPMEPVIAAQEAMWKEAFDRFAVNPGRVYAAGFSGGARAAMGMALNHRKAFAGVLCCGAVLPGGRSLPRSLPFAVAALAGTEDFNLFEFYQAERDFAKGATVRWMEIFPGPHRWPPPDVLRDGVEFFQACAIRKGQIPADPVFLERVVAARLDTAAALRGEGELVPALWLYRQTARTFPGTPGAKRAEDAAEETAADPEVRIRVDVEDKLETDLARLRRCEVLSDYERELSPVERLAQGDGWAAKRARWALTAVAADLDAAGLQAHQRGNYKASAALFTLAFRADPARALSAYNAACAYSRLNQRKEALAMLQRALEAGFKGGRALKEDPDLANARKEPGFQALAGRLETP